MTFTEIWLDGCCTGGWARRRPALRVQAHAGEACDPANSASSRPVAGQGCQVFSCRRLLTAWDGLGAVQGMWQMQHTYGHTDPQGPLPCTWHLRLALTMSLTAASGCASKRYRPGYLQTKSRQQGVQASRQQGAQASRQQGAQASGAGPGTCRPKAVSSSTDPDPSLRHNVSTQQSACRAWSRRRGRHAHTHWVGVGGLGIGLKRPNRGLTEAQWVLACHGRYRPSSPNPSP